MPQALQPDGQVPRNRLRAAIRIKIEVRDEDLQGYLTNERRGSKTVQIADYAA
jgi:hypothetical protein